MKRWTREGEADTTSFLRQAHALDQKPEDLVQRDIVRYGGAARLSANECVIRTWRSRRRLLRP
jgi:hypothetical protein